jgi:hypothetical protein
MNIRFMLTVVCNLLILSGFLWFAIYSGVDIEEQRLIDFNPMTVIGLKIIGAYLLMLAAAFVANALILFWPKHKSRSAHKHLLPSHAGMNRAPR